MATVGSTRTGEELGRAFPGVPVVVSGAREAHGVVDEVDGTPRLVVATPGAEPVAEGGYRAVLLLDGGALSSRPDLGAGGEALRQWSNAVALAAPSQMLCREGCLGLCPECGADLNAAGPEHAHEAAPDPRWAKLSELRFD